MPVKNESLTAEVLRSLLDYNESTGEFTRKVDRRRWKAGQKVGHSLKHGYSVIGLNYCTYHAHRLAWLYAHGEWPPGMLDHINGDRTDNRICNLRLATPATNSQNQRRARSDNKSSGVLGVSQHPTSGRRFRAKLHYKGCTLHLGMYDSPEEAHDVYVKVKRALHEGCTL
jgi:hypothetical protein